MGAGHDHGPATSIGSQHRWRLATAFGLVATLQAEAALVAPMSGGKVVEPQSVTITAQPASDADRQATLRRRIKLLVATTISYNVVEAFVALSAGAAASSTALIGFGLDSVIEVSSALAVFWQFSGRDPEARERNALRLIACSFFALAAFVTFESLRSLVGGESAEHSSVGIVLAAASLCIMPFLSYAQRKTGRQLGSKSAVADSKQTLLCTYLSAVLLVGLVLNSTLGWSWADPIAALVIAAVAVREGLEAWRGDDCCSPAALLRPETTGCSCGPDCSDGC